MSSRGWVIAGLALAAALLLVGRAVTTLLVDHAWYAAMGAPGLWWERMVDTVLLQGGTWVLGSAFAFANLHAVRRTILAVAIPSRVANIEMTAMIPARRLLSITILLAVLVGLALAAPMDDWTAVALARHGVPFGEIEFFLDKDLGFFLYWLPLEEGLYLWALLSLVAVTTIVLVLYALTRSLRLEGRRVVASTHVRRHLSVLGALVLLLLAWSYRLDAFDVLREGSGPDGLFLRVDHVVTLRVDLVLAVMSGIAAMLVLRAGWMGQLRLAFITVSVVLISSVGLRHALPSLIMRGNTLGEPGRRDLDYLATRTLVSRRAYDVDGIRFVGAPRVVARTSRVALADVESSVSLWDAPAVRARLGDGTRTANVLAAVTWRASEEGRIDAVYARRAAPGDEAWHVRLADATRPVLIDSGFDLQGGVLDSTAYPASQEPLVAPGYQGYRLVPDSTGLVLGSPLDGTLARVAHAWAERDPALLTPDSATGRAVRFVSHRDVRERVGLLAPVLAQGEEVLPLVHDGVLYWTVDLYSASDSYPLSQRWLIAGSVRSYFRHAATALVEGATGRVRFLPVDRPDPLARTWLALVPSLILAPAAAPPGLVDRLPPATDGAIAQLRTFAQFGSRLEGPVHRTVPDSAITADGPVPHLVRVDGQPTLAWSVPLLDGDQLGGLVTAVGGRQRATYWDTTIVPRPRWETIRERLRLALDSARSGLPDGSRREPRVRPGRVQAVLTEQGPLFLQPLQWNRGDGDVLVSRVAVLLDPAGGSVGVGMTAGDALARLGAVSAGQVPPDDPLAAFTESREQGVTRLYEAMREAMRAGNWSRFGAAFDSLGRVLGRPPE